MHKKLSFMLPAVLLVSSVVSAKAPPVAPPAGPPPGKGRFSGSHPLAARPNAGYCYIDVPHVHDYLPDRPTLYQQVGDSYVFTGDPTPFGYEGQKTVFYGHHPVPVSVEPAVASTGAPTFCFMKGPHNHEYAPPEGPGFKVQNNVVFYVGPVPPAAAAVRPQAEQALEAEYRPYVAQRPHVVVTPPPEWAGVVWVAPPAPAVVVAAPAPPVVVAPAAPTVIVAPPTPAVIIGAPPPVIFMHGHGHGHGRGPGWWGPPGHWKGGKGHWKGGKGHW